MAIDSVTRKVVGRYPTADDAAEACGTTYTMVSQACYKRRFPSKGTHIFRFDGDYITDELWPITGRRPLYVSDGERLRCFYGVDEAAKVLGTSVASIRRFLQDGEGVGLRWGRLDRGLDELLERLRREAACQSKS